MKMEKTRSFDGLVGRAPIYSQSGHKLLGYVQVANAMTGIKGCPSFLVDPDCPRDFGCVRSVCVQLFLSRFIAKTNH